MKVVIWLSRSTNLNAFEHQPESLCIWFLVIYEAMPYGQSVLHMLNYKQRLELLSTEGNKHVSNPSREIYD